MWASLGAVVLSAAQPYEVNILVIFIHKDIHGSITCNNKELNKEKPNHSVVD